MNSRRNYTTPHLPRTKLADVSSCSRMNSFISSFPHHYLKMGTGWRLICTAKLWKVGGEALIEEFLKYVLFLQKDDKGISSQPKPLQLDSLFLLPAMSEGVDQSQHAVATKIFCPIWKFFQCIADHCDVSFFIVIIYVPFSSYFIPYSHGKRKYFLVIGTPHDLPSWRECCRELKLICSVQGEY